MNAPLPCNETTQLKALQRLAILDTPEEACFECITRLAARLFGTRTALINLVDSDRQWSNSSPGTDFQETARSVFFCADGSAHEGVLTVEDARLDARFASNPWVTGPPHIRFYAGTPLRTLDEVAVGALCLLDDRPRHFGAEDRELLQGLANWAQSEINSAQAHSALLSAQHTSTLLQALLDQLSDALIICDAAGSIEFCNYAAEKLFGYERAKLVGCNARMLMLEPYCSSQDGYRLSVTDFTATRCLTTELARCADGSQVPIERRISRLSLPGKELHCHMIRDARHREDVKSVLLAAAAHELRSPLASICGFAELLNQQQFDPARQREMLGILHQQASHMTRLVNDLLDLARIEARGGGAFEMRTLSLAVLVKEIIAGFMVPSGRNRPRLTIEPGLPDVCADPDKIQQALCNILSNAYKYSPRGGEVSIEVQRHDNSHAAIAVSDSGIGMTPEEMKRAFEHFYRADQSAAIQGTGLGLSLVKEIIEHHGGSVTLSSTPGKGTTVVATLLIRECC